MYNFIVPKQIKKAKNEKLRATIFNAIIIIFATALAGIVSLKLYLTSLPPINNLEQFRPNIITKVYSSDGEIIRTFTAYTFKKVDLKDVPDDMIKAIVSTEDKNFYKHEGYDLIGLARSIVANIMAGRVVQGASTITQQLSRLLFLSNEKTYTRKFKEFVIAARIEKTITKDQILEMYLNSVYLGSGAYGVEGAAQIYFNKHVNQLTLGEIALIAGLPQAPSEYSPFNKPKLAIKRRNQVLKRMYKMRYIDKNQYKAARAETLHLSTVPQLYTFNKAPYFCDYVLKELDKLGFDEADVTQGGYKIVTTLNYKAQQAADNAVRNNMNAWGMKGPNQQAAVFSYNPNTGEILVYLGGKDYTQSQFDRVTQAVRPPGSAFKPFVYAAALEKGLTPNDMVEDMPVKIGDWAPKNYGNKYRGEIPIYTALMVSSNVAAARVIEFIGIRPVIQLTRMLGITTDLQYDYTIALGSNGVKLYEMTKAYGAFANGGYKVEPYSVVSIESPRGKLLYKAPKAKTVKVLSMDTASTMTAMLKTVITHGTGMAANIGKPAAAKTGTTDDSKDATFFGYTPNIVTGVWVGNDDNTKMGNLTGGTVPALIWKDVMKVATEPYGAPDFDYPEVTLKPFKAGSKSILISPDAAQKMFDKESKKEKKSENSEDSDEINESSINLKTPEVKLPIFKKEDSKANLKPVVKSTPAKMPETVTPKAEPRTLDIKPVEVKPSAPTTPEPVLAPIPMASPY